MIYHEVIETDEAYNQPLPVGSQVWIEVPNKSDGIEVGWSEFGWSGELIAGIVPAVANDPKWDDVVRFRIPITTATQ